MDKLRAGIDDRRRGPAGRRVNRSWRRVIGLLHALGTRPYALGTRRRGGAEPVRSWLDLLGLEGLGNGWGALLGGLIGAGISGVITYDRPGPRSVYARGKWLGVHGCSSAWGA